MVNTNTLLKFKDRRRTLRRGVSILEILIAIAVISLVFPPVFELFFYFYRPAPLQSKGQSIFDYGSINKKHTCDNLFDSYSGVAGMTDSITAKSVTFKTRSELGLSTSSSATVTGVSVSSQNIFLSLNSSSTTEPDIYNVSTGQYADTGPGITTLKQFGPYFIAANSGVKNQVQIIRKDDLSVYKAFLIPGSNGNTNPITKSFTVARGLLFVGTEKSVLPEIFIFDINTGQVVSSIETGYGVNDLYVLENLLFVASPRDPEVEVFDITYLGNPQKVAVYDAPGGSGNGKVLEVQDNKLLLGRTKGGSELLSLNIITDITQGIAQDSSSTLPVFKFESYVEQKIGWSIDKMASFRDSFSEDYLLLLTADSQKELQIYKYKTDTHLAQSNRNYSLVYSYNLSSRPTDFVCSKNKLYVTTENINAPLAIFEF